MLSKKGSFSYSANILSASLAIIKQIGHPSEAAARRLLRLSWCCARSKSWLTLSAANFFHEWEYWCLLCLNEYSLSGKTGSWLKSIDSQTLHSGMLGKVWWLPGVTNHHYSPLEASGNWSQSKHRSRSYGVQHKKSWILRLKCCGLVPSWGGAGPVTAWPVIHEMQVVDFIIYDWLCFLQLGQSTRR